MQNSQYITTRLEELEPLMQQAFDRNLWLFHGLSSSWFSVIQLRELIRLKQYENVYPAAEFVLLDPVKYLAFLNREGAKACRRWIEIKRQVVLLGQRLEQEPNRAQNKAQVQ